MANLLEGLNETIKWRLMVEGAKRGLAAQGYTIERVPGRGLSNIWDITKGGQTLRASIRTTRDRWIAFPRTAKGTKWKTLDEVEVVVVASVDNRHEPENVEVYILPAEEVRERFNAAYAVRLKAGQKIRDNFGMWVNLDPDNRGVPASAGAGIVTKHKRVAIYSIPDLIVDSAEEGVTSYAEEEAEGGASPATVTDPRDAPQTIADVMAWARERVASLAGVKLEAVKLDLKVEY